MLDPTTALAERLTTDQLTHLAVPTCVAMGGISSMHDAGAAAVFALQNVPDTTVRVWPPASHSLPMEVAGECDGELLRFMASNDG